MQDKQNINYRIISKQNRGPIPVLLAGITLPGVIPSCFFKLSCTTTHSWNKAVLERWRRNEFFLFFLRWFDFTEERLRSLGVNLKSYSHQHWPSKVVISFLWELAVVTNKPWSKRGCLCSHIPLQKSTHARKHWHQGPHNPITLPGKAAVWPGFWKKVQVTCSSTEPKRISDLWYAQPTWQCFRKRCKFRNCPFVSISRHPTAHNYFKCIPFQWAKELHPDPCPRHPHRFKTELWTLL